MANLRSVGVATIVSQVNLFTKFELLIRSAVH